MQVTLHFVAKESRAAELADLLRARGSKHIDVLPRDNRVLLVATADDLANGLDLQLERADHDTAIGPLRRISSALEVPRSAKLPPALAELVEQWYTAIPPDRYVNRDSFFQ